MSRRRKIVIALSSHVVLLVAGRIALPYVVEDYVNDKLAALDSYDGHVSDIDIHLWRGAYSIDGIEIVKTGASRPIPFFRADRLNLSVEWRSLMHGSIVSEASFLVPRSIWCRAAPRQIRSWARGRTGTRGSRSCSRSGSTPSKSIDGTVRFLAPGISTKDAITARHVNGSISNLTNVLETGKETFADFRVTADVLDGAPATVAGSANAFAAQPTFDVNLEVKKVELPQVNPWLREYIKADAEAGKFELYMELAAADGKFKGYAKPILQDVDIYRSGEAEQSALKRAWEGFLDFAANVFENQDADQVAARIPFSGTIKNPETSLFATIASVMRNAFVSAFARSLEGSITLRDVKKNLNELDPNEAPEQGEDKEKKSDRNMALKPKPGPAGKS